MALSKVKAKLVLKIIYVPSSQIGQFRITNLHVQIKGETHEHTEECYYEVSLKSTSPLHYGSSLIKTSRYFESRKFAHLNTL